MELKLVYECGLTKREGEREREGHYAKRGRYSVNNQEAHGGEFVKKEDQVK